MTTPHSQALSKPTLSTAVVEAVASAADVEPTSLTVPLYEAVNPDALDTLFRTDTGAVTFEYYGYEVTVHATGEIDLVSLDAG